MQLEEMSTTDVKEHLTKDKLVVIPVGSTEQHGPQNPLGTDYLLATHVARKACDETDAICAPPIPVGISEHHSGFAGTLWFSSRVFANLLLEYALSLIHHGFNRIVFFNGHGGNVLVLKEVVSTLYFKHKVKAATINWYDLSYIPPYPDGQTRNSPENSFRSFSQSEKFPALFISGVS